MYCNEKLEGLNFGEFDKLCCFRETLVANCSARNKDHKLVGRFLKMWYFNRLLITVPLKMYWKYGQPKWILVGQMLKLVRKWPMADCYF